MNSMSATATSATACIELTDGVHVMAPDDIRQMTPYVLMEQRDWFEDEIKFVRRLIRPGAHAIDIGANFGVYALAIAKAAGPTGRVWAVEPAASTAAFLRQSVAANRFTNVTVLQYALSNRDGAGFLQHAAGPELNSLATSEEGSTSQAGETVNLLTLDGLVAKETITAVDFVKIDAEGQEERILAGGANFLRSEAPLLMLELKHGSELNSKLIDAVIDIGYAPYRLVPGLNVLTPISASHSFDPFLLNFFACRPERALVLQKRGLLSAAPPDTRLAQTENDVLPESDIYPRGLHHYRISRDTALSPLTRVDALFNARVLLARACESNPSPARLASIARASYDCGERSVALEYLAKLMRLLTTDAAPYTDEPFLPVCRRFDTISPDTNRHDWWLTSVLEQYELLSAFSSYFASGQSLQRLELLARSQFASDEMLRRHALVKRRAGLLTARSS